MFKVIIYIYIYIYKLRAVSYDRENIVPFPYDWSGFFDKIKSKEMITWNQKHSLNSKCILIGEIL